MTSIEWTEKTWNPTTGCDRVSPGCTNCYAATMARRLKAMGQPRYQHDGDPRTSGPGFGLSLHPDVLGLPYTWRTPQHVFVNSMSDLFHARVPLEFIQRVFAVMADTPHTYQVLTKRARRLRRLAPRLEWPANVWMGVSVEDREHAARIAELGEVPAAVRFLSCEPLLGPLGQLDLSRVRWVIVGGESGPGARPLRLEWVHEIRQQAADAGAAVFVKQLGAAWQRQALGTAGKGSDPATWPEELRVRQMPNEVV